MFEFCLFGGWFVCLCMFFCWGGPWTLIRCSFEVVSHYWYDGWKLEMICLILVYCCIVANLHSAGK